jgi:hypothetical protein
MRAEPQLPSRRQPPVPSCRASSRREPRHPDDAQEVFELGHFSGDDMALIQGIRRIFILNRRIAGGAREQQAQDQYDAKCTHEFLAQTNIAKSGHRLLSPGSE